MPRKPAESIGKMARRKTAGKVIRVCPMCRKAALRPEATLLMGWMTGRTYYFCTNCGYHGSVYVEVDVDEYDRYQRKESFEPSRDESNSDDLES